MDGEVFDGNEIIFCDKCNVPVHQMCYGVHTIPEGDWMCDVCAAPNGDPAKTTCELCSHVGGAYKVTDKGKWIHALCATWVPEVFVADVPQHPQPYTLQNLDKKRYKLKCALCNTTKGAAVQCSYGKCVTALEEGWLAALAGGTPLLRLGPPLAVPAPRYDPRADAVLATVQDAKSAYGMAAVGSGWHDAWFDNFAVAAAR